MIDLLSQFQLIVVSFLFGFFFSFFFTYIFEVFLQEFNFIVKNILTIGMFIIATLLYFYLCLIVCDGNGSFYQVVFMFIGVLVFHKFYYPSFSKLVKKRKIKTHKFIEKYKNTLYNQIKKMGGIFRGRSRKKREKDYADY